MDARWSLQFRITSCPEQRLLIKLAPLIKLALLMIALLNGLAVRADAANRAVRTANFAVVDAPTPELAQQVAQAAEQFRRTLAIQWLGKELPRWSAPCTIRVVAGNRPCEGVTNYNRYPGHVGDFQMVVIGTPQRILDSVLPHEVTHTVLATHFGRPLPRWADEGLSTTVEHVAEKSKHDVKLKEFLTTGKGIPMNQMFMMTEYPPEMLTLYAQGYSVCRFLVEQNGPQEFIKFIETYFQQGSWTQAVRQHYRYASLEEFQQHWLAWVQAGSGPVAQFAKIQLGPAPLPASDPPSLQLAGSNHQPMNGSLADTRLAASQTVSAGDGWYQRRRQATLDEAATGLPPKSHSTAQPGPELGAITAPVGSSSAWNPARRFR
ncbi:hypothetical protein SH139x_004775 [Planctomycetaceae bacterium SH139]